ncbi:hypothetical protein A8W25_29785 [Streptomyces sp. ERV7]|nr:hypothetical protein A8W25_29785 [Streptomyces sp. ERV7]
MCFIFCTTTAPYRSSIRRRLFLPAAATGGSSGVRAPSGTRAGDGKNLVRPLERKKSCGVTSLPSITSSLKYRKCSARPSMWWSWLSMACELKVGSRPGSRKISLWLTTLMPGCAVSSQSGVWSSVTR